MTMIRPTFMISSSRTERISKSSKWQMWALLWMGSSGSRSLHGQDKEQSRAREGRGW